MKTRFTKTLAIVLTSICGASLIGSAGASAQTVGGFTATPLPPLPKEMTRPNQLGQLEQFGQLKTTQPFDSAAIATVDPDTDTDRLFAIQPTAFQAPPIPPKINASARIVRLENKPNQAQDQTQVPPKPIADLNDLTSAPPIPTARVAEAPNAIFNRRSTDSRQFSVSFTKAAQDEDSGPEIGAASPEIDTMDSTEMPEMPSPDTIEDDSSSDALEDLESDVEKSDRETENRNQNDRDEDDLDASDSSDDDLDDLDVDEDDDRDDEDRPQRKPRQFGVWPKKTIQEVQIDVRDSSGDIPKDESEVLNASSQRYYGSDGRTEKVFAWAAPNIRYQPLYFEDVALERYGQTKGLVKQPIVSAFKFLRDGALLPFNAKIDNPYSCDTPLGFCRPGSPRSTGCGCATCRQR